MANHLDDLFQKCVAQPKINDEKKIEDDCQKLIPWIASKVQEQREQKNYSVLTFNNIENYHEEAIKRVVQMLNRQKGLEASKVMFPVRTVLKHPCGGRDDDESIVNEPRIMVKFVTPDSSARD